MNKSHQILPLINPELNPHEWLKQRSGLLTAGTYGMCVKLKVKSDHIPASKQAIINKLVTELLNHDNELAMNKYPWLNMIKPVAFNTLQTLFKTGRDTQILKGGFVMATNEQDKRNGLAGTVDAFIPEEDAIAIFITPSSVEHLRYTSTNDLELDVEVRARVNFLLGITQAKTCYTVFVDPRFIHAPLVVKKVTPAQEEIEATIANAYKLFKTVEEHTEIIGRGIKSYNNHLKQEFSLSDEQLAAIYKEFNFEFESIAKTKYNAE